MSYQRVPPAYYTVQQPETPAQEGSPGWATAPVPNWGDSAATAFPKRLGVGSLGAAATPPFFRASTVPFASYVRVPTAPWGRFPNGPAYASPKEAFCPTCVGVSTPQPMGASGCPKCTIPGIGDQCLPCDQDTASQPECEGCDPNEEHDPHGRAPGGGDRFGGGGGRRRRRDQTGTARRMDKAAPNAAVVTLAPAPAAPPVATAAPAVAPTDPAPAMPPAVTAAATPGQVPWLAVGLGLGAGVLAALVFRVRHS